MFAEHRVNNTRKACNTKNQRGRPRQSVKRTVLISLRLTWSEYKMLRRLAPRGKVSTYIRRALFKQKVKSLNMEADV
jgi:hypothetical protein